MLSKVYKGLKHFFLNPSNFRIAYLVTLYFANVCVIRDVALVVQYVLMFWAALIIYFYYIKNRRILKIQYSKYLILYLVSITITSLINIESNFGENMLMAAHIAICFFAFYGMHTEKNKKRIYREIYVLSLSVIIITFALNLAGFPLACMSIHFEWRDYLFIIYENRYTGFFINPNLLGFSSAVAIIFAHFLTKPSFLKRACAKPPRKWVLYIMSAFNLLCMFLSDSNASFLLIACYVCTYIFFCVFKRRTQVSLKQFAIKVVKFVAYVSVACILLLSTRVATGYTVSQISALTQLKLPDSISQPAMPDEMSGENQQPVTFKHENANIDSGRIRLFTEAITLIENYPLFGMGKANLVPYSEKYIEGGLHFSDLHNGYLTIIACSGIVGFVIFVGFAFHLARHVIKSLFIEKKNLRKTIFPCLFSFTLAYCIYAFVEKALLYEQSFMVVIFWAVLGYLSVYMLKYDHLNDPIEIKILGRREERNAEEYDAPEDMENVDDN